MQVEYKLCLVQIVKEIVEKFDILSEDAEKDVARVLEEFRALNLLEGKP